MKKNQQKQQKQTAAHDWLGDCAENYVAYLFSHAGFEVFGAGKWAADVVIHDKSKNRWWRIEVRSTDKDKTPVKKSAKKLKKIAEMLANVRIRDGKINVIICKLKEGKPSKLKKDKIKNPNHTDLYKFVQNQ